MNNIVLMAGSGKRFSDAGYKQSKPLIPVSGKPMIVQAVKSMPKASAWVFVVRQEHLEEKEVIDTLKHLAKDVTILVDPNPIGQLNSCLVARDRYEREEPMFVGACDLGMVYGERDFKRATQGEGAPDMLVFSFTKQPNLPRNPQAWGWLKQDEGMNISGVSVKVPISDEPYNDYAIVGSFWFKSGVHFQRIADELMRRGITVKGEYYIDSMIGVALDMGYKVKSFPVKYIGWGVPADYEEYRWWENAIAHSRKHPEAKEKKEYAFWHSYFTKDMR
jgi:dTDP-glucose pyrophosphorylase